MSGPKIMFTFVTGPGVVMLDVLCPGPVWMGWTLTTGSEMVILDIHGLAQMPNVLHPGPVQKGLH